MSLDSLLARAALPSLLRALERWEDGRLALVLPDGSVRSFGREGPRVELRVKSPAAVRRLLLRADIGFGESYVEGEWETSDLPGLLVQVLRNEDRLGTTTGLSRLLNLGNDVLHRLRRNTRRGSRRNVSFHYDLSNDFYRLFLDEETMAYSSAFFASADEPLADAQKRKLRRMADKARLRPGDRVLEIGCGWGGFAILAAREYGCRVTGITISEAQHRLARERVAAAGLEGRVELRLQDYRDVEGRFDKVVSIEMFEALGREHWPAFFRKVEEVLLPHGLAVVQAISIPDRRFAAYERHCDWIQKHVFPGGVLASLHHATGAMMEAGTLVVHHLEDIGIHYARTLALWRGAFLSRLDEVRALGFDERFVRTWDFYLASCQALFATGRTGDLQVVLTRPDNEAVLALPAASAPRGRTPRARGVTLDALVERDLLPDRVLRLGIRRLVALRAREVARGGIEARQARLEAWVETLRHSPIALETRAANEQHYEVPAAFFRLVLGRRLKYSCALWAEGTSTLDEAEEAMLRLTGARAGLADGQRVLELGCGWGSLTLWMAERYPASRITAVSNSAAPAGAHHGRGSPPGARQRAGRDRGHERLRAEAALRSRRLGRNARAHAQLRGPLRAHRRVARAGGRVLRPRVLEPARRLPLRRPWALRLDVPPLLHRRADAVARPAPAVPARPPGCGPLGGVWPALRADLRGLARQPGPAPRRGAAGPARDLRPGSGAALVRAVEGLFHGLRRAVRLAGRRGVARHPRPVPQAGGVPRRGRLTSTR